MPVSIPFIQVCNTSVPEVLRENTFATNKLAWTFQTILGEYFTTCSLHLCRNGVSAWIFAGRIIKSFIYRNEGNSSLGNWWGMVLHLFNVFNPFIKDLFALLSSLGCHRRIVSRHSSMHSGGLALSALSQLLIRDGNFLETDVWLRCYTRKCLRFCSESCWIPVLIYQTSSVVS